MRHKLILTLILATLLSLSACSNLPGRQATITPATATPTSLAAIPDQTPDSADNDQTTRLLIWLPPDFDPNTDNEAGALLAAQLQAFSEQNPNIQVETRIKAIEGSAGLFQSLTAASASAPLVLPDLILLPTNDFRHAADKDLILPLDELMPNPFSEDWYAFAAGLGMYQNRVYGMPFAVEALVMAYRPSVIDSPPKTWEEALKNSGILSFPAANPEALFTTTLYLSENSSIYDDSGQIFLNQAGIETIFDFYRDGLVSDILPFWLTQNEDYESSWQVFQERRASLCITWSGQYIKDETGLIAAAPLPTRTGEPFTITSSWTLALPVKDPENYAYSLKLAQLLTESSFIGKWTEQVGYFPPRADSLLVWQPGPDQGLASQILPQAIAIPLQQDLQTLGSVLTPATISLLKAEKNPQQLSKEIVELLANY